MPAHLGAESLKKTSWYCNIIISLGVKGQANYLENIYGLKIEPSLRKVIYGILKCTTGNELRYYYYSYTFIIEKFWTTILPYGIEKVLYHIIYIRFFRLWYIESHENREIELPMPWLFQNFLFEYILFLDVRRYIRMKECRYTFSVLTIWVKGAKNLGYLKINWNMLGICCHGYFTAWWKKRRLKNFYLFWKKKLMICLFNVLCAKLNQY